MSQLKSELCVWYVDDSTIGRATEDVKHDLEVVIWEGPALGLPLNQQKTELIGDDYAARDSILPSLPGAHMTDLASAFLLGSLALVVRVLPPMLSPEATAALQDGR